MTSPLQSITRNLGKVLSGQMAVTLLGFAALSLNSRALQPSDLGSLMIVQATCELIQMILAFQNWQMMVRFGTEAQVDRDPARMRAIWRFGIGLDLGSATLAAAIVASLFLFFPGLVGLDPHIARWGLVYAASLVISSTGTSIGALRLHDAFGRVALIQAAGGLLLLANAAVLFALDAPIETYLVTIPVFTALTAVTIIAFGYAHNGQAARRLEAEGPGDAKPHDRRRLFAFALSVSGVGTINAFRQRGEVLVVGGILGPHAAALFGVAYRLAALAARVAEAGRQAVYPELSRMVVEGRFQDAVRLAYRMTRYGLVIAIPAIVIATLFGETILALLFGTSYRAAAPNLALLTFGTSVYVATFAFGPLIQIAFGPSRFLLVSLVAFSGALIGMIGGPLLFGTPGAGAGAVLFAVLLTAGSLWMIERRRRVSEG